MIFPEKNIPYHSFYSSLQKAMHLGSNPSLDHCGPNGNDARFITKAFCRDILGAHYRQPDLKVWLTLLITKLIFRRRDRNFITIHVLLLEKFSHFIFNLHQPWNVFIRCKHNRKFHSLFSFAQRSLTNSKKSRQEQLVWKHTCERCFAHSSGKNFLSFNNHLHCVSFESTPISFPS